MTGTITTTFERVDHAAFIEWYASVAEADAAMVWQKAKEYGSFTIVEEAVRVLVPAGHHVPSPRFAVLALNCSQKLNRILEALGHGAAPAEDCWRDLACYAMIARRLSETMGAWPA